MSNQEKKQLGQSDESKSIDACVDHALSQAPIDESGKEFRRAHRLLRDFLNHTPVLSFIKDEQGKYLYANKRFFERFNVTEEEVLGKTDLEWLPEDIARQFIDNDQQVRATGKVFETIETVNHPNGVVHSLVQKFPINDQSGRQLVGGIAVDITERLKVEELQAQLAAIVNSSHDAIIGTTQDGIIHTWNTGARRMLGYTVQEMLGQSVMSVISDHCASESAKIDERLTNQNISDQFESIWKTKDGRLINVSVVVSQIQPRQDKITGVSIVARDISNRIEMEQKLRKTSEELAVAHDQALAAAALKSTFVSNISHELRTPLTGILGMIELLLGTELTEEQQRFAKIVDECSNTLLSLVNDILDLSKIEAGKVSVDVQPFNLIFLVQDCARLLASSAGEKKIALKTNIDHRIPDFVQGDQKRVRQTLLNLMSNSIKFTEVGEINVEISVESKTEQAVTVRFSVKDTGIGISQADRDLLFKPFSQVDSSSTRKYQGTGLGLYITKQLVEMMGGQIQIESRKGEGTFCWFSLPFGCGTSNIQVSEAKVAAPKASPVRAKNEQVLIVEDSEIIQDVVQRQLASFGINAQVASNGQQAIELVSAVAFDLILMDIQMPVCDGYEATKIIRKLDTQNGRHTPIIALTASAMPKDKEKCLEVGMDDYMSKPVKVHELEEKVKHWLMLKYSNQD